MINQNWILAGGLLFLTSPWDFQKNPENNVLENVITFSLAVHMIDRSYLQGNRFVIFQEEKSGMLILWGSL